MIDSGQGMSARVLERIFDPYQVFFPLVQGGEERLPLPASRPPEAASRYS
ncbi:hypothetical protein DFAR_1630008 [Desulfarculales bacterium]